MNFRTCVDEGVKVFLVLDFDGVLNQFPNYVSSTIDPHEYLGDYDEKLGRYEEKLYKLSVSRELVSRLNFLLADERVQLVWLTTWKSFVLEAVAQFGLKSAREPLVVDFPEYEKDTQATFGKITGLAEFFSGATGEGQFSVVWVDDFVVPVFQRYGELGVGLPVATVKSSIPAENLLTLGPETSPALKRSEVLKLELFVVEALKKATATGE